MALYLGGMVESALDDVGIYRALNEVIDRAELFRLRLEHADELLADYLALALGLALALELGQKAFGRVDCDKVHLLSVAENAYDLLRLALS